MHRYYINIDAFDSEEVQESMGRVLRIVLSSSSGPVSHASVRARALGRDTRARRYVPMLFSSNL